MDQHADNPLSDSALEREIETLARVEPSPEFLARVRTRIAQEPAPASWRWSWGFALAGAAAVAVLAVSVWSWTLTFPPIEVPQQAVSAEDITLEPAPASIRLEPDTHQPRVRSVRLHPSTNARGALSNVEGQPDGRAASDAPAFTEVLISEAEQRAFAMLLTRIEQGRLPPVPAPADAAAPIEPPAIVIRELVIEPLPEIAQLE